MLKRVFILLGLLFLVVSWNNLASAQELKVVKSREIISFISKSKSKLVLINFWATWCPACRMEIPSLIKVRNSFSEKELSMLGVSLDYDPQMFVEFMKSSPFNYPVWLAKEEVGNFFQVVSLPKTVIYRNTGEKVFSHSGYIEFEELKIKVKELLGE